MTARRIAAALLALCGIAGNATAAGWPDVPLPDDSRAEWVSRHMVYNGVDMRALRFDSTLPKAQAVAFYERAWRGRVVRDDSGGKVVLGHLDDGHYVTVELQSAGAATRGTIGIMRLPGGPPARPAGHGFARPAGSEVVNDIRYLDTPREARTLVLRNAQSPHANRQFYRQRLASQGWRATGGGDCRQSSTACLADFEKADGGRMRLSLRRERDDRTVVVANLE